MNRWRLAGSSAVVAAALILAGFAQGVAASLGDLPSGWVHAGSAPESYQMGIDAGATYEGSTSIALWAKPDAVSAKFGTTMQTIDSQNYRGKRVRFRAAVRAENVANWAGLWMRVDGSDHKMLQFDNMWNRPIKGSSDWTTYDVVLDVPTDSADIAFGILLDGRGDVWLAKPELTEVDPTTPTTSSRALPKQPTLTW
jgi:hypothetical protein